MIKKYIILCLSRSLQDPDNKFTKKIPPLEEMEEYGEARNNFPKMLQTPNKANVSIL